MALVLRAPLLLRVLVLAPVLTLDVFALVPESALALAVAALVVVVVVVAVVAAASVEREHLVTVVNTLRTQLWQMAVQIAVAVAVADPDLVALVVRHYCQAS